MPTTLGLLSVMVTGVSPWLRQYQPWIPGKGAMKLPCASVMPFCFQ